MLWIRMAELHSIQKGCVDPYGKMINLHMNQNNYLLLFAFDGEMQVVLNDNVYVLSSGQTIVSRITEKPIRIFGNKATFYMLKICCSDIDTMLCTEQGEIKDCSVIELKNEMNLIVQMCEHLLQQNTSRQEMDSVSSCILSCIISVLFRAMEIQKAENDGIVGKSLGYIKTHIAEDISVNDIAEYVHVSASYLAHEFKEKVGIAPIKYIIRTRMDCAKDMLAKTRLPITTIAIKVGYDNSSYFSLLFKKIVGESPAEYRKKHREQG